MKFLLKLPFVICFGLLVSCKPGGADQKSTDSSQTEQDTSKFTAPQGIVATTHMIEDLLKRKQLETLTRNKSLGGYFHVDDFKIRHGNKGVLLWHCYNPKRENSLPLLFFALEQVTKYDSTTVSNNVPGDTILAPIEFFTYSPGGIDFRTVIGYLQQHKTKPSAGLTSKPISKIKVSEYTKNFTQLMDSLQRITDTLYCKYPQAFFIDNISYKNFLGNFKPTYVRYYLGFTYDSIHEPNYLRPILGGAKDTGETIDGSEAPDKIAQADAYVQKSVPPPPR